MSLAVSQNVRTAQKSLKRSGNRMSAVLSRMWQKLRKPRPESAYVKAQKDQERLNRNRQEFEQEKTRERERLSQYEQQLRQREAQIQQQAQQARNGNVPKYSAKQYAEFADECTDRARQLRLEGDYDEADKQVELATKAIKASQQAGQYEATAQYEEQARHYEALWTQNMETVMQREADTFKDPENPVRKQVEALLGDQKYAHIFERIPNGFEYAVEVARLRNQAGLASGLEKENKELKAKLEDREKRLGLSGSGPTGPSKGQSLDDMGTWQAMEKLERMAAEQNL